MKLSSQPPNIESPPELITSKRIRSARVSRREYGLTPGAGIAPLRGKPNDAVLASTAIAGGKLITYGDAPAGTVFQNQGGPVIGNVDIQIVFWGREWASPNPPVAPGEIQNRIQTILHSPYLSKVTQYGCSGTARVRGTTYVTDGDPPNPFNDADVQSFVSGLIDNETLPEPDEDWDLFVCVFMPTYVNYGPGGVSGAHSSVVWSDYDLFDVDNDRSRLAWIGNPGGPGAIDAITTTFSHELVEACTDPDTTADPAWRQTPCTNPSQCEIGDVCSSVARVFGVQVQAYWSQSDGACVIPAPDVNDWSGLYDNWRPIGGFFPAGAPITAVSRYAGELDLFVVGNDGRVYTSWWSAGSEWSGLYDNWRSIGGYFRPGSRVAAVARTPNNLDLFICGNDGRVYTSWWSAGSDWSGVNDNWRNIGGVFPAGAPVSVVARTPNNLDLFICGGNGRVYTSWWSAGSDWSGLNDRWRSIGGVFPAGAPVAAVARTPNNLDLFICGGNGRVYTSWWSAGSDWSGVNDNWRNIGGVFPAATPLAAIARTPNNLDLFICGNDGRVYTSWWSAGSDWSGLNDKWRSIGGVFPAGTPLAAVARTPNNLDVFICGGNGRVYTSWWSAGSDWSGVHDNWRSIGGVFPAGAPVAAVARTPNNLDVFICGGNSRVYTSWWSQ
jgi:hypothetical protein